VNDVTVLIPVLRSRKNEQWLQECISGFPKGTKYFVAENDGDMADALNEAIALVDTEWVMPFGHDDVPQPNMLDFLFSFSCDADVIYPRMLIVDEDLKFGGVFNADVFCGNRLQTWNFVPGGGFLARTEMVRKVGGYRDLETLEDWDLHVRMFRAGARFKACPDAEFAYRQVEGSRNRQQRQEFPSIVDMRTHYRQEIVGTASPTPIATFYFQATPAVSYWRCVVPARHLPGIATSDLTGMPKAGGGVEFLDHYGAGIFQFPRQQRACCGADVDAG